MADVVIFVPGDPRGKARARFLKNPIRRKTKAGKEWFQHTIPESKTLDTERDIAWQAKKSMAGAPPFAGPVMLKITARYEYPKSWSAKRKASIFSLSPEAMI